MQIVLQFFLDKTLRISMTRAEDEFIKSYTSHIDVSIITLHVSGEIVSTFPKQLAKHLSLALHYASDSFDAARVAVNSNASGASDLSLCVPCVPWTRSSMQTQWKMRV